MAKGIGLIGNFRGKVGNMVGYNLKDSNNKQTQGVRVYQPVVKNPKSYAQAEQRAKLAPINALYRTLKPVIDRGQEGIMYGNKSRLAWLKTALKTIQEPWVPKGSEYIAPALVPITHGSLNPAMELNVTEDDVTFEFKKTATSAPATIGALSAALKDGNPNIKDGDQVTFIAISGKGVTVNSMVVSIIVDATATGALPTGLTCTTSGVVLTPIGFSVGAAAIVLSREGSNGEHLRSTATIFAYEAAFSPFIGTEAKEAAIKSYMAASGTTDWPEEKIQG